ncbi:acetyl-CoA acetyltransferase [Nocardia sp. NBC_00511]|uniref:thiolase family protein n=1 Tax=Nocardia sp. NBC_00511 TaxID=2903591 RepID=UPI0030DEBE8B
MRRAAVVMPMRTPVGLPGGALAAVPPYRLVSTVVSAVLDRAGLDPLRVEQLVTAVPDSAAVRRALPLCGLSPVLGDFAVGGDPGAGLRALITASMMVSTGAADVVLVIGAEYPCATAETGTAPPPRPTLGDQDREPTTDEHLAVWAAAEPSRAAPESAAAEELARLYGLTRTEVDDFAATSHRRAARARRQGFFGAETAPVVVCADPDDVNSVVVQLVDRDEGLRDDVSHRAFAALPPLHPGGITTVANSSTRTLAASACLVVAEDRVLDLGLEPMAYLVGWAAAAAPDLGDLAERPVPATTPAVAKALWRSGFELAELELLEIEETSAVDVLALTRTLGFFDRDGERLNVHGGAIALGDPGGAASLRMVTTMLHELSRRDGGLGLVATPAGAAGSLAAVFESPDLEVVAEAPRGARFRGAGTKRSGRHRNRA